MESLVTRKASGPRVARKSRESRKPVVSWFAVGSWEALVAGKTWQTVGSRVAWLSWETLRPVIDRGVAAATLSFSTFCAVYTGPSRRSGQAGFTHLAFESRKTGESRFSRRPLFPPVASLAILSPRSWQSWWSGNNGSRQSVISSETLQSWDAGVTRLSRTAY